MLYVPSSLGGRNYSTIKDCEKLFGSPGISSSESAKIPPIASSKLSLCVGSTSERTKQANNFHIVSPTYEDTDLENELKEDTRGAALLLASMKSVVDKEIGTQKSGNQIPLIPSIAKTEPKVSVKSQFGSVVGGDFTQLCSTFEDAFRTEKTTREKNTKKFNSRVRTVSVESASSSPLYGNECMGSSFQTDALPSEKICLDLTSQSQTEQGAMGGPAEISPPSSPQLQAINPFNDKGPRGLKKRKSLMDIVRSKAEPGPKKQKNRDVSRPSILSVKEPKKEVHFQKHIPSDQATDSSISGKKILRKKFSWKNYPELENFLIANREDYLRHSAMNYTMQQKEYNNRLTERLIELANESGYVFDEESFSFVSVRDRIRCYFKSYVQSKKKRGVIIGYAARKAGLLSEEQLEKSAAVKGKIVVPKKASKRTQQDKTQRTV